MTGVAELVRRAEGLCRDYRLEAVADWKRRHGGLAVGFVPIWAPRELLHSQGVLPVAILGAGDDLEIIKGDAFYQSYICHLPRSVVELGLNGSLQGLDGMLFPSTCDVIRNLSGIWKLQFGNLLVRYLDLPQDFDRDLGGRFFVHELQELSRELTARGALPYDAGRLAASLAIYDQHRAAVEALYDLRRREPHRVPTHELYVVLRAGSVLPVEEHLAMLRDYAAAAAADATRRPLDQARVLISGSFCEQPPLGLIKTLERAGCYIVDDDFLLAHRWIRGDVRDGGDPLQALVGALLRQAAPSAVRWIGDDEKGRDLVERVGKSGAEGVIFCAPSFCDPALLDQPMLARALDAAGVPWTSFKYAENTGQFQVIREQAGTFADSIKLWSGA
jgi:benzoyl-CoA reductase subunit C